MKRRLLYLLTIVAAVAGVFLAFAQGQEADVTLPPDAEGATADPTPPDTQTWRGPLIETLPQRFPDAPPDVLEIAAMIARGEVPPAQALEDIGPERLNQSFGAAVSERNPAFGHTLLREAVLAQNPEAAAALIARGARTDYNANEMPYQAINLVWANDDLWYPDFSRGVALTRLWLEAGGDPMLVEPAHDATFAVFRMPLLANLEGHLLMYRAGADPWAEVVIDTLDDGYEIRSSAFAVAQANASPWSTHLMFRLAREGLLGRPTQPARDAMDAAYQRTAGQYIGSTGPENLRTVWRLQMAVGAVYEALGMPVTGDLADLMEMEVPADLQGFFLGPGEIRSPDDPDQKVRADNQHGTERWDG